MNIAIQIQRCRWNLNKNDWNEFDYWLTTPKKSFANVDDAVKHNNKNNLLGLNKVH